MFGVCILADSLERQRLDRLSASVVDAAITVHSALGPGLLESAYEACLVHELSERGIPVASQVTLPVKYRGTSVDAGYRLDMVVGGVLIIEVKAVEKVLPIHSAQLLTYLKLSGMKVGFLMNFNTSLMRDGITRMVNKF